MKRGKAKEDLLRKSSSGVGAPPDLAETLPMSPHMAAPVEPFPLQDSQDKQTVEYIPEDSQAPVDDVVLMEQDGEVQFQAAEGGQRKVSKQKKNARQMTRLLNPLFVTKMSLNIQRWMKQNWVTPQWDMEQSGVKKIPRERVMRHDPRVRT